MNEKKITVYDVLSARIIGKLQQGVIPWRQPWKASFANPANASRNGVSGRYYRGINGLILGVAGFESPFWLTFKQITQCGGYIRQGEHGTPVEAWFEVLNGQRKTIQTPKDGSGGKVSQKRLAHRFYKVFNIAQCEGLRISARLLGRQTLPPFNALERADAILTGYPRAPKIEHGKVGAYYSPGLDLIGLPSREAFHSSEGYYATAFHELAHSTGHASRLDRVGVTELDRKDDHKYSFEELIAELGSAFLCGEAGIEQTTLDNSAAYLASWLKRLQEDTTWIVKAAARAQEAAEFILDRKRVAPEEMPFLAGDVESPENHTAPVTEVA